MLKQQKSPFLVMISATFALAYSLGAPAGQHGSVYEIVRATESQVWRLNKHTGEIAVCALKGEQLICTSSAQAATPPAKTYAQLEAEREEAARLEAERRAEKRKRSLAMLNLMLSSFREIAIAGAQMEQTN